MRIPKSTIKRLSKSAKLLKVTQTIVNHRRVEETVEVPIKVTVIPADKTKIVKENIDYSLLYVDVYSLTEFFVNDVLLYKNRKYRAITNPDFSDFGYYYALMVEVKES